MTVRVFRSTDASAPVLDGVAGSLVGVLDACLVSGYGATVAAGWTIAYTAVNQRVYTMGAGGTGFSLEVNDAGPGSYGGREARAWGIEAPTGLGAGTGRFPSTGQTAVGSGDAVCIKKSSTADGTARPWTIVADENVFYLFVDTGDYTTVSPVTYPFMFGDIAPYSSSDNWNCLIIGRTREAYAYQSPSSATGTWTGKSFTAWIEWFAALNGFGNNDNFLTNTLHGHFMARNYTGVGGSLKVGKVSDLLLAGFATNTWYTPTMGYHGTGPYTSSFSEWPAIFAYPHAPDNGLYTAPVYVVHNGIIRGYMRGMWCPLQDRPCAHNDTYSGTGNLAGKSFLAQSIPTTFDSNGHIESRIVAAQVHMEISDTWN